jgi:hypothetical protein
MISFTKKGLEIIIDKEQSFLPYKSIHGLVLNLNGRLKVYSVNDYMNFEIKYDYKKSKEYYDRLMNILSS